MTPANTANTLLPSWRQGCLLFFTSVIDPYTTRLDYRVVAKTNPGETNVYRTYKAAITADELARCQETANDGTALQLFFHSISRGNLDDLVEESSQHLPPCAQGSNSLIYICSYFNFLRKYSVDQTLVKHYEARDPAERFEVESSLSIYKILSGHLQPERAAALLDADLTDIYKINGAMNSVANLLREAAVVRHDTGAHTAAIEIMRRAAKLHNTEDKWRRLADFAIADKNPGAAIDFFLRAESMAPLAPPQSLRVAGLLIDSNQADKAAPFMERAEIAFKPQVESLRAKINSIAAKDETRQATDG